MFFGLTFASNSFGRGFVADATGGSPRLEEAKLFKTILEAQAYRKKYWSDDALCCKLVEIEIKVGKEYF